jgi:hypothetical protein
MRLTHRRALFLSEPYAVGVPLPFVVMQARLAGMEKQRLLETLEELRVELSQAEGVDPDTLAALQQLTNDLQRKAQDRGHLSTREVEPASSGLKDLVLRFEADHPQLAVAVGRVADALAAMGI